MAKQVMPNGDIVRCSGWPTCKYCAEDAAANLPEPRDEIDEIVNHQLTTGRGN